jgi:exopolysaccharide production protein ExoQ
MRHKLEKIFTILALFLSTGAILPTLFGKEGGGGSIETQLVFLFIYLISAILAFPYRKKILYFIFQEKTIILLCLLATSSVFWSGHWYSTMRGSFALFMSVILGGYIAARFTIIEQIKIITWVYILASVLSLIACLLFPHVAIHSSGPHEGLWRGIYIHKNAFGRPLGLGSAVLFLVCLERQEVLLKRPYLYLFLVLFLLVKSGSVTPTLSAIVALISLSFYNFFRWPVKYMLPVLSMYLTMAIVSLFLIAVDAEAILNFFGRDLTLTGRSELWILLYEKIKARPLLGYGFEGFWRGWDGHSGDIWSQLDWSPNQGHNGFIDLTLFLGLIGLMLFILGLIKVFLGSILLINAERTVSSHFPAMFLTYYCVINIGDNSLLRQNNFYWIVYVALCFSFQARSLDQRFKRYRIIQPEPKIRNASL